MRRIRAACHVHSEWSYDGSWSLKDIATAFAKRGYQVVMLTEHDRGFDESRRVEHREACRRASSEQTLLMPGIEYSDELNCVHTLLWGDVPFIGADVATTKVLACGTAAGGVAVMAHPSRKEAWRHFYRDWRSQLLGIEGWNRKADGWAPSPDGQRLLFESGLKAFVGLDFHNHRQFFPLAMVLDVEGLISEASVMAALQNKRFSAEAFGISVQYFSRGVGKTTLGKAESFRKTAASIYRRLRTH